MDFGRNLLKKTMTSGLSVTVLDFSPASRRNRQEVPQEQPDEDPRKPCPASLFLPVHRESLFSKQPGFPNLYWEKVG